MTSYTVDFRYDPEDFEKELERNNYIPAVSFYPDDIAEIFVDWLSLVKKPESGDFAFWKSKGIDFNNQNYDNLNGFSPLRYACHSGNIRNVIEMLKYGTDDIEACKGYFRESCRLSRKNYNDYAHIFDQ